MICKPDDFRALDVKIPLRTYYSSQKGYKTKLATNLIKSRFSHFDMNTHCLIRQDSHISEKLINDKKLKKNFYFLFIYFKLYAKYLSKKSSTFHPRH
jgi:hypothetical protein